MHELNISLIELSKRVDVKFKEKDLTLESCCQQYNQTFSEEIKSGAMAAINKDFVSRVKNCGFKTFSHRVAKLCEFLDVDLQSNTSDAPHDVKKVAREISDFITMISSDNSMNKRFASLKNFLIEISNLGKNIQGGGV